MKINSKSKTFHRFKAIILLPTLPHYLGVFIDGKTRKIRYTHPSNRNQANMVCVRKRQRNYD